MLPQDTALTPIIFPHHSCLSSLLCPSPPRLQASCGCSCFRRTSPLCLAQRLILRKWWLNYRINEWPDDSRFLQLREVKLRPDRSWSGMKCDQRCCRWEKASAWKKADNRDPGGLWSCHSQGELQTVHPSGASCGCREWHHGVSLEGKGNQGGSKFSLG